MKKGDKSMIRKFILKKKFMTLNALLMAFTLIFSFNVNAQPATKENIVSVESHDKEAVAKALGLNPDEIKNIEVYDIVKPIEVEKKLDSDNHLRAWYDTKATIKRTAGPRESWSATPMATDYISPGGSISHTYTKSVSKSASFTVGLAPLKEISAQLGYDTTTSSTVSKTLSQSNNTSKGMYVDVYVIYSSYDYSVYGSPSGDYYGKGSFTVATGLGVITR
jgi:hypothetical protein